MRTTAANLEAHKWGIPWDSISKVFQDAIMITRKLGVRYLWIDSLCIIQEGNGDDMKRELSKMPEIYENGLIMLSASVARDGSVGMIPVRSRRNVVPIAFRNSSKKQFGNCYVSDWEPPSFEKDILAGHLSTRAWCLQERILAPRILHFGTDQMYWECCGGIWSEGSTIRHGHGNLTASDDAAAMRRFLDSFSLAHASNDTVEHGTAGKTLYNEWYHMATKYTARKVTYSSDRLRAISAVARRVAKLSGDDYVAGLWVKDIANGLLWSSTGLFNTYGTRPRKGLNRCFETTAPSWSWASVEGKVEWPTKSLDQVMMTMRPLVPEGSDPFLGSADEFIYINGWLRDIESLMGLRESDNSWCDEQAKTTPQENLIRKEIDDERVLDKHQPTFCLLVGSTSRGQGVLCYGLLVQRCGAITPSIAAYRRVGIAQISLKDFCSVDLNSVNEYLCLY